MEDKAYIVYLHINPKNKKVYVGITNQDVYRRWKNGHGYTKCKKFYNAIMKYGWDNFKHIVLCKTCKDRALLLEKTLVKYYKSRKQTKRKIGLVNRGAMYGKPISDYARKLVIERFSKAVLQLDSNDNIINRFSSASEAERHLNGKGSHISCCCLGKRKTAYGYKWKYE